MQGEFENESQWKSTAFRNAASWVKKLSPDVITETETLAVVALPPDLIAHSIRVEYSSFPYQHFSPENP